MSTGSGGCCSLECGAKTIAWIQAVVTGLATLAYGGVLIVNVANYPGVPLTPDNSTQLQDKVLEEEQEYFPALFSVLFFLVIEFILSIFLLYGIYKVRMNYVAVWLVAKGCALALVVFTLLIRLMLLFFNVDSDLTHGIIWLVIDALQALVIFVFWQEKKSEFIPVN